MCVQVKFLPTELSFAVVGNGVTNSVVELLAAGGNVEVIVNSDVDVYVVYSDVM